MTFNEFTFSLFSVLSAVVSLSVIAVFVAIFVDFIKYNHINTVKKSKRSIVATGSMIGFYIVYYLVLRFQLGTFHIWNPDLDGRVITGTLVTEHTAIILGLIGTPMIAIGSVVNILGRIQLKGNWANHIKIYEGHSLINRGVYSTVRHPLYASIMLMLFGGSIAYRNWLSAALTIFVFIPFMYYRARQEEVLLKDEFIEYDKYSRTTGMFFPRIIKTTF